MWESTPHSGGYYHPTADYWANGALKNLWISQIPSIGFGADGEGRTSTVSATYGAEPGYRDVIQSLQSGHCRHIWIADHDNFIYDPNTGRMTQYKFTVGTSAETANLTWNSNTTLKTLAVTDPWIASDNQTCAYGYDNLSRVTSANCGSAWSQTFAYDPLGNATKSGSSSWLPTYNSKNQYASIPGFTPSYDSNGNILADSFHSYTWQATGHVASIDTTTFTYDALGRNVEQNRSGTYYQIVYAPTGGKLAIMTGQNLQQAFIPLPGRAVAEYLSWGLSHYRHPDWLGSDRLASSSSGHTIVSGAAYAPFGEPYAQPSGGNGELSFTGANKDTIWLQYDFPARQYDPRQSRWMSPDPGGLMAVDLTSPQSWNRYGYVANSPLSTIDPLGFRGCAVDGVEAPCSVADGLINLGAASPLPPAIKPEGFMSSQNGTNVPYIVTNTSEGLGFKYFGCNAKAVGLKYCNNEGFAEVLGLPTFIPSETWLWNHERDGGPLAAYLRSHAGDFVVNHIGGQKTAYSQSRKR